MTADSRQDRKLQTRTLLIEVATRQIEQQGFDRTTIRAIADEAGVAPGTVFVHFESKTDLLHCAFHGDLDRIADEAIASLPAAPLEAQLHHLVAHFYRSFSARPDLYRTLLKESLLATGTWGERFSQQVERVALVVGDLFESAKAKGDLDPALDTTHATRAFFSFYYFLLIDAAKHEFEGIDERLRLFDAMLEQQLAGARP